MFMAEFLFYKLHKILLRWSWFGYPWLTPLCTATKARWT